MKKNNTKFKAPNYFIYLILLLICKLIAKFKFRLKIERNDIKKVKGHYVVLANHESAIDFINLVCCTNRRLSMVISNSFYQSLKINPLMKMCGVIPKQQFQTNVNDMKKMRSAIQANRHLVIYPAGLMTENGISTPIPEATGKFIQWLGADVYIAYTKGSYLTSPKWGKGFRKGQITLNVSKFLTKEQLKEKSPDDLQKMICDELYYDSYKHQEKDMVKYKNGNNIIGLENVLYWCPKCGKEFTNKNVAIDTMKCEHCGNEVFADNYGFLNPRTKNDVCYKHVSDWYRVIYDNLYNEIENAKDFSLVGPITLKMLDYKKHQFVEVCKGTVSIDQEKFRIICILDGEEKEIIVPIKKLPILPFKPGVHFEVQDGNVIYRCCLDNGQEVSKWINALKVFYEMNNIK